MGNVSFIYQRIRVDKRDIFIRYFRYFNLLRFRFFTFFNNYNRIFVQLFIRLDRIEDEMQSWRLNGIPWGLQKWPMSAISKGRSGRQAAGKSYYSLYSWYRRARLSLGLTHPPRWSVLTRERNPPSGSTNQIAASVAHAIASMNPPATIGYGVLYHPLYHCIKLPFHSPHHPTKISNFFDH